MCSPVFLRLIQLNWICVFAFCNNVYILLSSSTWQQIYGLKMNSKHIWGGGPHWKYKDSPFSVHWIEVRCMFDIRSLDQVAGSCILNTGYNWPRQFVSKVILHWCSIFFVHLNIVWYMQWQSYDCGHKIEAK